MRNKWRKTILKATDGLLATAVDLMLFQAYLLGSSVGKSKSSGGVHQAFNEAHEDLAQLNYQTIKTAYRSLKRKGFIKSLKEPEITAAGRKKLGSLFPFYDEKRVWDGSLYLVTYDIPEKVRKLRNKLRDFLKTISSGKLQDSVWLTVYNPQKLLKEFVQENNLRGSIIVSCIGKDGYIGEESLGELIDKVFYLSDLNERYRKFLEEFSKEGKQDRWTTAIAFYSVLQDDPQLPWDLLPADWLGTKAYQLFKRKVFD